jgi:hypothetical protein
MQLLEGIGAIATPKAGQSKNTFENYQDDIITPLDRTYDVEAACDLEEEHDSTVDGIQLAISKVCFFLPI